MSKEVQLFNGEYADVNSTVKIKGKYYLIDRDCFNYNGKWYRNNSPSVVVDSRTGKYFLKRLLNFGIVKFKSNGDPIFGFFSGDIDMNRVVSLPFRSEFLKSRDFRNFVENDISTEIRLPILNESTIPKEFFREKLSDGVFYSVEQARTSRFFTAKGLLPNVKNTFDYEAKYKLQSYMDYYKRLSNKPHPSEYTSSMFGELGDYTYGFEFETDTGYIPKKLCYENGLMPLRDGSINGIEFATIPMKFPEDLGLFQNQIKLLNERTLISARDSTHVHIGGYPLNKEMIYALYVTIKAIEDELFSIVPKSFKDTSSYKRRSYNSPLPLLQTNLNNDIHTNFEILYNWISGGLHFEGFGYREHPRDQRGQNKWYVEERYTHINLVSLLFGKKRTVEFRSHPCTKNLYKLIYWMFVCTGVLKYAQKNCKELITKSPRTLKLTFYDIFYNVYSKELSDILLKYVNKRKEEFWRQANNGDSRGIEDVRRDHNWEFSTKLTASL